MLSLGVVALFKFPIKGRVIEVSPLHPLKAEFPMLVTLSGTMILVSPLQPLKAEFPMLVTLEGIVILVIALQPLKASAFTVVTGNPLLYTDGIKISLAVAVPTSTSYPSSAKFKV